MDEWVLESQRPVYDGWLKISRRTYVLPDGHRSEWDVLTGGHAVAVVARTTDGRFVIARQYRAGPGRTLLEIPGGHVDPGEDVVEAGVRELLEETGYAPASTTYLGSTWLAANFQVQRHFLVADGCRWVTEPDPGPEEFTEVVLLDEKDFVEHVRGGQLTDQDCGYRALDHLGLLGGSR
ncbi:ADP-ribose pyrophosphatase [Actinopolymorpha cephalotaxi]|uniref:ADP-ribose pyrophosphatase n=1 Tax=Actinopolymorpha cephalotaxi TaxID=504797 RepID=A0A1I2PIM2_9ACTN|nr:NUDIX hydrolase [Actinopolymorpha cephalotaxi]NYH83681.1 ADP-ribose pyrophosphatase [Actinopolymorpha cephalotaxi]SFG13251.1 ADP-ribose pyrophosphatase [Actinopolymorpha cephalotaxi]